MLLLFVYCCNICLIEYKCFFVLKFNFFLYFFQEKTLLFPMLSLLIITISTIYSVNGELVGPVTITENGQKVTRYAVSTYATLAKTDGSSIILQHNSQVQIALNASSSYSPDIFQEYKLKVNFIDNSFIFQLINQLLIIFYYSGQNTFIYSRSK